MARLSAREREEREARRRTRSYSIRQQVHTERGRRRRRDDVIAAIVLVAVLALATTAQVGFFTVGPGAPKPTASLSATPTPTVARTLPPSSLSEDRTWTGTLVLNTTSLSISLNGKKAPQAVANFVSLVRSGFYADVPCHRLTTAGIYVLQCGDPTGTGNGGPGYTFGPIENAPKATVTKTVGGTKAKYGVYPAGTIAMARGTAADSQGSQFFIVYRDSELPAPGYTVFGKVTNGLGALKTAITGKGTADGSTDGAPKVSTSIAQVVVE
ncbi:peptidylprolyl isomerase [uncultured Amnibacterium sp.]|uniref:peptidylprolyl isomerase n=1 Tax=uncultured Amnibacterium sp. TaxID=1631851 RepID=UPI0035CB3CC9